jgi:hypothetical protein
LRETFAFFFLLSFVFFYVVKIDAIFAAGFMTQLACYGCQVYEVLERLGARRGGYVAIGTVEALTHTILLSVIVWRLKIIFF